MLPPKLYPFSRQKSPFIFVKVFEIRKITLEFGTKRITVGNTVELPKLVLPGFAIKMSTIEEIIKKLELQPHPEGGYYRRFFEAETKIATPRGER